MIRSLPYSQILRVKKIVSVESALDESLDSMNSKFLSRGYPQSLVRSHVERGKSIRHEEVVSSKKDPKLCLKRIPFVSMYGELSPKISSIINKHWPIIYPTISEFKTRLLMSYWRPQNLTDRLLKSCVLSWKKGSTRKFSMSQLCQLWVDV